MDKIKKRRASLKKVKSKSNRPFRPRKKLVSNII